MCLLFSLLTRATTSPYTKKPECLLQHSGLYDHMK